MPGLQSAVIRLRCLTFPNREESENPRGHEEARSLSFALLEDVFSCEQGTLAWLCMMAVHAQ